MDIPLTEEQTMLQDAVARFLADMYDLDQRRSAVASTEGWRPAVWTAFAQELGILGATIPEELGGLGGGPVDMLVIMRELGRALVVEPYIGSIVLGAGLLQNADVPLAAQWIGEIIAGRMRLAFAQAEPQSRYDLANIQSTARRSGSGWILNGQKSVVIGAPWATHLLVTARTGGAACAKDGVSLFLVERDARGLTTRDYATVDGLRASDMHFEDIALPADALIGAEGEMLPAIERAVDEATVAVCAEACGILERLHADTITYTRERRQFGRPISSFQVIQHRIVDMFIMLEQAMSMTYMASLRLGDRDVDRAKAVSAAKVQIARACRFVGQNAVQLHGGMGITDELAVGHYFKRATIIEMAFGSAEHHLTRYEALSFGKTNRAE